MSSVPEIGVSMTTGMSLEHWSRVGFLDRELSIYGKIADAIGGRIVFISYGGPEESDFLGGDPRFDVIPKAIPKANNLAYSLLAGPALRYQMNRLWLLKSNQMRGSWVALSPQRRLKLPFLLRCGMEWLEGLELSNQNTKLYRAAVARAEHFMYHRADAIMLPNPTSVRFVQDRFQIQAEKIHLFMNSIDCDAFTPENPSKRIPKRIVFVGRIYPTKRIELLLKAAATIPGTVVAATSRRASAARSGGSATRPCAGPRRRGSGPRPGPKPRRRGAGARRPIIEEGGARLPSARRRTTTTPWRRRRAACSWTTTPCPRRLRPRRS